MFNLLVKWRGLPGFFLIAGLVFGLTACLAFVSMPIGPTLALVNLGIGIVFMIATIAAIFIGAAHPWRPLVALAMLVVGTGVQALAVVYASKLGGVGLVALESAGQIGLLSACLGLGVLLTFLFREKAILVPVAITLVFVDMIFVLTPTGHVGKIAQTDRKLLEKVSVHVPSVKKEEAPGRPPRVSVSPQALVGAADYLFMSMFFVALFKFGLNPRKTLKVMGPLTVLYLLVVLVLGGVRVFGVPLGALPAMVPIAGSILIVNWGAISLKRDEKLATLVLTLLLLGVFIALMRRPAQQSAPLPSGPSPESKAPQGLPAPASTG
ncbi:MAG: hypothetical protein JSS72_02480 [Armatimonadetes bacterium]|nr:hypothetical protein [Armatimonadota bacterium]